MICSIKKELDFGEVFLNVQKLRKEQPIKEDEDFFEKAYQEYKDYMNSSEGRQGVFNAMKQHEKDVRQYPYRNMLRRRYYEL